MLGTWNPRFHSGLRFLLHCSAVLDTIIKPFCFVPHSVSRIGHSKAYVRFVPLRWVGSRCFQTDEKACEKQITCSAALAESSMCKHVFESGLSFHVGPALYHQLCLLDKPDTFNTPHSPILRFAKLHPGFCTTSPAIYGRLLMQHGLIA